MSSTTKRSEETMWKTLALKSPKLIPAVWELATETVQAVEAHMKEAAPEVKKKESIEAAQAAYKTIDAFFNLDDELDTQIRDNMIPHAIGLACDFLNATGLFTGKDGRDKSTSPE